MAEIILSADIGTSSLKAAFIDTDGRLIAFSRAAYGEDPEAAGAGGSGAGGPSAQVWERAFARALEALHARSPACVPGAVCISGNGPTLVPVTREGEALGPLYWHGGKAVPAAGSGALSFFLPHAAWFKQNAPADYKRTSLFISSHEWLAFRLGAEALTVLPQAAYEPYYWDDEQLRLFGLEAEKFPAFVKSGNIMGRVSERAASPFGSIAHNILKSGTPIIAGGPDFISALIGTGTMKAGDVCDRAGSSEGINVCTAGPVTADSSGADNLRVFPHAREGFWNVGAVIPRSGSLFEQYRAITAQQTRPYKDLLAELIPSDDPDIFRDAALFPPHSPLPTPYSPVPVPQSPLLQGRSVLCAIGFAVRKAAAALAARGFTVREMIVSGGQGKNPRWNQLKADITGISLKVPEIIDGELAGNAVLAAAALGGAATIAEGADKMVRVRDVYKPRVETASFWDERCKEWEWGMGSRE